MSAKPNPDVGAAAPDTSKAASSTSFGSLCQIDAGLLSVGYAEEGPAGGPAVVLLHGWPYDIHSYIDVVEEFLTALTVLLAPYREGKGPSEQIEG